MILYFLGLILSIIANAQTDTNACQVRCSGNAPVKIDVAGQCMCVEDRCFKVGIGWDGASMTDSGNGKLHPTPPGEKYQTFPTDSTAYDKDAIAMGIPGNDATGKWIHKPANCVNAETYHTKGCIAVPCDIWPILKNAMRKEADLTVCNGYSGGARMHPNKSRFDEETQSIK